MDIRVKKALQILKGKRVTKPLTSSLTDRPLAVKALQLVLDRMEAAEAAERLQFQQAEADRQARLATYFRHVREGLV